MKKGQFVFKAYRSDNAVDGFPDGLAPFSTIPVNPRSLKIGLDTFRPINWKFQQVLFYSLKSLSLFIP